MSSAISEGVAASVRAGLRSLCQRNTQGGLEKGLGNLWRRKKITKRLTLIVSKKPNGKSRLKLKILMNGKVNCFVVALLIAANGSISTAFAQQNAFTYQGQILENGSPANGDYSMTFTLFNSTNTNAAAIAGPLTNDAISVANGLFTTLINFPPDALATESVWLQIGVATNGATNFITLAPRHALTPAPYALFSQSSSNVTGPVSVSQLTGTVSNSQLTEASITLVPGPGLSGGGAVSLGASTTLSNTGVLSITGNADITVTTVEGATTLGDTATPAGTPDTIVKRNSSGDFTAETITLTGNLRFPSTDSSPDIVYSGSALLFYGDGSGNLFIGENAGNSATPGTNNTAIGVQDLQSNAGGFDNTAIGYNALLSNISGYDNTANGIDTLADNTFGSLNTATGYGALSQSTTGIENTATGGMALQSLTGGNFNTAEGVGALQGLTNGEDNIAFGYQAGSAVLAGNNNIHIGNAGQASDNGIIRIGTEGLQAATYLTGNVYANAVQLTSDRNAKENLTAVNPRDVLARVTALPVTQWNYKTESKEVQHIGPMAQDFQAAFRLSADAKHISVGDESGVALAAIQGLNQKLDEKDAEIQRLEKKLDALQGLVNHLVANK
jgi:hypothetical protein